MYYYVAYIVSFAEIVKYHSTIISEEKMLEHGWSIKKEHRGSALSYQQRSSSQQASIKKSVPYRDIDLDTKQYS